jgi:hypothetical protein
LVRQAPRAEPLKVVSNERKVTPSFLKNSS